MKQRLFLGQQNESVYHDEYIVPNVCQSPLKLHRTFNALNVSKRGGGGGGLGKSQNGMENDIQC